jgi:cell division protein YceG involved in septum cleavage
VKRLLISLLVLVLAVGAAAAGFAAYAMNRMQTPYKGFSEPERFIDIPQGTGAADIRRRLVDAGVVSDEWASRAVLAWTGQGRVCKSG